MTSIRDVAKHAGVSNATISRYFHEPERVHDETRKRIQDAIKILGYLPNTLARNLRLGKTKHILTLVEWLGDAFYGEVLDGITRVAAQQGYKILIQKYQSGDFSRGDLLEILASRQADGVIILGGWAALKQDQSDDIEASRLPIVVCGESADSALLDHPRVQIDGFAAAREVTQYLLGQGHRRIAFMGAEANSTLVLDRENGYRKAMADAGIAIPKDFIAHGNLNLAKARRAARQLVNATTMPTAIVCANDEMAIGTMSELYALKIRVPEDISIVGFDNTRYGEATTPPLTTVAQPSQDLGETAVYHLLKAIKDPTFRSGITYLPHRLIIRDSVAPPRD